MASATNKRKSKPATSTRADSGEGRDSVEDERAAKRPLKKTKTAQPSRKKLNEYDEDKGRQSSRDFLNWGSWQQDQTKRESDASGKFLAQLQATLAASQADISKEIQKAEMRVVRTATQHADRLKEISAGANAHIASTTGTETNRLPGQVGSENKNRHIAHPLYNTGNKIMAACRMVLDKHEHANRQTLGSTTEVPHDMWRQDNEQLLELLTYGRLFGERVVQSIVSPEHRMEELTAEKYDLGETSHAAIGLFSKTLGSQKKSTVGQTMRKQFNAFADLDRTVAED